VNHTSDAPTTSPPLSRTARSLWAVLILVTLYLCYFHNLGAIGLVGPDEPRYAWIARDMAETGDWVTPRLYGKPWFEKPPLYYWGAALSFKIFGVSEAAARLPSAVCALLATLAMAWLSWRAYGAETARWVLLLLPTTVGMIGFSHAAATDMPFAAMLTIAMVFAAKLLNLIPPLTSAQTSPRSLLSFTSLTSSTSFISFVFGFFLGLATLAKGPAALILSGGGVLLWAAFTKRWRDAFRCLHPVAIASFCLTALPWYLLCARRNPDFFRVFIIEHNFKRFLTPEFQHIQPFWYYLPILLIAFVPWLPLTIWSIATTIGRLLRTEPVNGIAQLFLCFSFFCLVFFSISKSKLPGYILPAFPLLAFVAFAESRGLLKNGRGATLWVSVSEGGVFLALMAAVLKVMERLESRVHPGVVDVDVIGPLKYIPLVFLLTCVTVVIFAIKARIRAARIVGATGVLLSLVFALHTSSLSTPPACALDGFSVREMAARLSDRNSDLANRPVYYYKLNRAHEYSFNYYLHRELKPWEGEPGAGAFLLTEAKNRDELHHRGWVCPETLFEDPIVQLCTIAALPGGLGGSGSGGTDGGSTGSDLNDREPR
jgi:4-amino-4-deoxy-L-arabinose transferase-like glycosyltransferase